MTNIKTQAKTAFGKTLHYVTDPVQAAALSSLTGKKTINEKDIANLKTLTGKKTINDNDIIALQMLGLQVNGVNYIEQLQLVGV